MNSTQIEFIGRFLSSAIHPDSWVEFIHPDRIPPRFSQEFDLDRFLSSVRLFSSVRLRGVVVPVVGRRKSKIPKD